MPPRIYIAVLNISERTAAKLSSKHGLDSEDVRAAVVGKRKLPARFHDHPERGRRALVSVQIGRRDVTVVLYPTGGEDEWNLGSAYPV